MREGGERRGGGRERGRGKGRGEKGREEGEFIRQKRLDHVITVRLWHIWGGGVMVCMKVEGKG